MSALLSRRKFMVAAAGLAALSNLPRASAGRFQASVINFVQTNYNQSLKDVTQDGLSHLIAKVAPIEEALLGEAVDLRSHFDQNWSRLGTDSTRSHTEKCPYCISVARDVERRMPELAQVQDRIPSCFIINGAQYIASDWGSLHRYNEGRIGRSEGTIWFANGDYVGRGHSGDRFLAMPNC
ncbi:MAG: hypothetical protein ABJG15_12535 [Hyphomonadaceae bacterium]